MRKIRKQLHLMCVIFGIFIVIGSVMFGMSAKAETMLNVPTLSAKIVKKSRVKLTWGKVDDAYSYTVYRSKKESTGYKKLATSKKLNYTDCDMSRGVTYYYKVIANHKTDQSLNSPKSDSVKIRLQLSAPKVIGSYAKKKIKLTWNKVKGADAYYVYKKNANKKYELVKETDKLYYSDRSVIKGKAYTYKVVAVDKVDGEFVEGESCGAYMVRALEVDPNKKMVALTYDDGPGRYTADIVKCLKENQARATFYVLGCNVNSYKNAIKEADKIGCEIGNHTYYHPNLTRLSGKKIEDEIEATDSKIKKIIGHKAITMRPPGGSVNQCVQENVGKPIILWSIDTKDWEHRNSGRIIQHVMNNVKDGDIILMHDIYASTKSASLTLIPRLRREGYQLVTVSELAQYRGYSLEKGKVYHSFRKKK